MKELAKKYFLQGYSCSEAMVQAAADKGYISQEALCIATSFSGGMGVKCLCGTVAGAQMVIGAMYGKKQNSDGMTARKLAKEFYTKFTEKYKVACCKVLSSGYEFASPERKQNCSDIVSNSAEILENLLIENKVEVI